MLIIGDTAIAWGPTTKDTLAMPLTGYASEIAPKNAIFRDQEFEQIGGSMGDNCTLNLAFLDTEKAPKGRGSSHNCRMTWLLHKMGKWKQRAGEVRLKS